ncbi:MAG: alpha/beta fold hydrolase [Acidimicrobiales bacterium]
MTQPIAGPADMPAGPTPVAAPRLARHTFTLSDGHRIGLAVSGRGVPLVVVHGFTAEGFLYAQTLHRLVTKGFKVVAIDMAGHGGTQGLPLAGARLGDYAELMHRAIDELGIRTAVIAGHSMGGRVVAQMAAMHPRRVIGALLIDAIVGDEWDVMVNVFRVNPALLAMLGGALVADTVSTLPVVRHPAQAAKLGRLVAPTYLGHALQPWRLLGPAASILRSRGSKRILDELARLEVPTFVIHGEWDLVVPYRTAVSAARRANGQLVSVHAATHSWLLKDPETLPAIVSELLDDRLGTAVRQAIHGAGAGTVDEIEAHLYEPDAPILALTPALTFTRINDAHRRPRYRWSIA